jgi:hypothetical protein
MQHTMNFLISIFGPSVARLSLLLAALLGSSLHFANAHELPSNRMTVVLRDETHLSLTYWVDYPEALRRALMPQKTLTEFALTHSAMPAADFQKQLEKAHAKFSSQTRLTLATGKVLEMAQWRWPEAAQVQALLQQHAMQALAAPKQHAHATPLEIHAQAASPQKIEAISVATPAEFSRVLMVSYKPQQTWLMPGASSALVKF